MSSKGDRGDGPDGFEISLGEVSLAVISLPQASIDASWTADLTPAEREIFDLLIGPKTVADIAAVRSKSEKTIHNQIAAIYQKLGVGSRSQLMALVLGS